jgi:hypothetical protein
MGFEKKTLRREAAGDICVAKLVTYTRGPRFQGQAQRGTFILHTTVAVASTLEKALAPIGSVLPYWNLSDNRREQRVPQAGTDAVQGTHSVSVLAFLLLP